MKLNRETAWRPFAIGVAAGAAFTGVVSQHPACGAAGGRLIPQGIVSRIQMKG
jgi:hypothetical protein